MDDIFKEMMASAETLLMENREIHVIAD